MHQDILAIGCAAGFGGDRTDAADPIVETLIAHACPGVLIFEMLAERTLATSLPDTHSTSLSPGVDFDAAEPVV